MLHFSWELTINLITHAVNQTFFYGNPPHFLFLTQWWRQLLYSVISVTITTAACAQTYSWAGPSSLLIHIWNTTNSCLSLSVIDSFEFIYRVLNETGCFSHHAWWWTTGLRLDKLISLYYCFETINSYLMFESYTKTLYKATFIQIYIQGVS